MKANPLVTVITTVYNGETHLEEAIESIRKQTFPDWEFIIVDDGSTDGTASILARMVMEDKRLQIISRGRLGRSPALNVAWQAGSGRFIANLDADDIADPQRLEKQIAYLESHPRVGALGTRCGMIKHGELIPDVIDNPLSDTEIRQQLVRRNPIVHSSVMMRRQVLEEVGGYNEAYQVSIDYELWERIGRRYELANLADILVIRRFHDQRFFRNAIPMHQRISANMRVRWRAWRHNSNRIGDLSYVLVDPLLSSARQEMRIWLHK